MMSLPGVMGLLEERVLVKEPLFTGVTPPRDLREAELGFFGAEVWQLGIDLSLMMQLTMDSRVSSLLSMKVISFLWKYFSFLIMNSWNGS
jgi:hypothetical protein